MHVQCLALAGLLANTAIAGGQRHKRIVTEGFVYTGAPTAYQTGLPQLSGHDSSPDEFDSTHFQYAPTAAPLPETSTTGSVLTASATLRSTSTSVIALNTSSALASTGLVPDSTGTAIFSNSALSGYFPPTGATGSGYAPNKTFSAPLCTGQTLNVLSASLDWWYAETYTYVASIFTVETSGSDVSWSVTTPSTSFDITSALASPSCKSSLVSNPTQSTSLYTSTCSPTPGPVAASTIVITQTAYKPLNVSTGTGDIPNVATQPTPAAVTVDSQTTGYSAGSPFVFFSAYEIMSKSQQTYGNGSVGCAEATQRVNMPEPFSFEYTGGDANGSLEIGAHVTGDVNPAFLGLYSIDATAGSWVAKPTVVVVVEKVLAAQSVLAGETQATAFSLILPSPTLPSFTPSIQTTQSNWGISVPADSSAHIETSATALIIPTATPTTTTAAKTTSSQGPPLSVLPFVGHHETTEITLEIPAPATWAIITTMISGELITATALSIVDQESGNPAPDHTTHQESTASTQASPTNALEVLTAALSSVGIGSAILAGLGMSSPTALPEVFTSSPAADNVAGNAPKIVLGSHTFTANDATQFNLGPGATLTAGGHVVMSGTTISLDSEAESVVINGVTSTLSPAEVTSPPLITIGSTVYRGNAGSTFDIGGSQLTPGGAIILTNANGIETISFNSANGEVVTMADGTTITSALGAEITAAPALTIDGQKFTAINGGSTYMIDGKTLTPGGVETVTISGQSFVVSLSPQATEMQVLEMGSNGQVTATMVETLSAAQDGAVTAFTTVDATASQGATASGPDTSSTSTPVSLFNDAPPMSLPCSGLMLAFGSMLLVIWL